MRGLLAIRGCAKGVIRCADSATATEIKTWTGNVRTEPGLCSATVSVPRPEPVRRPQHHHAPGPDAGAVFCARRRLDETWRVVLAIGATAIVVGGAFLAIRFIIGLHL